jgi:hypothetical protein
VVIVAWEKITCWQVSCDLCGPDWWDDGEAMGSPHFVSAAAARRELAESFGWRITRLIDGRFRMICGSCAEKQDCEQFGHDWSVGAGYTDARPHGDACRRCGQDRHTGPSGELPLLHPESMTGELGEAAEEWLAALDAVLFPEEC